MEKSIHTEEYRLLVEILRESREKAKVTQVELAERLQETQSEVSKAERGERRLDFIQLRSFCEALGISVLDLIAEFERRLAQHKAQNRRGKGTKRS